MKPFVVVAIKKIYSSNLNKFVFLSILALSVFFSIYEDSSASLSLFYSLSPYLFLFFTSDMIKEEIERGYLENMIFLLVPKEKIFYAKIIAIILSGFFCFLFGNLIVVLIGLIKGEQISFRETFFLSLLVGTYYVLLGLHLGFFLKGASNALFFIILQILSLILLMKFYPEFMQVFLEKGIFLGHFERVLSLVVLILIPNLLLIHKKFFYFLLFMNFILFFSTKYFFKRIEFKRGE